MHDAINYILHLMKKELSKLKMEEVIQHKITIKDEK